ncbi:sugar dehydrogenase complex small subunit [Roseovarius dicentrarchi]|uniref:sugar dehydrogenase complex small subunit n=1 Tax=Roseovarius dicentrarchi TaxID=2250573 RepID=UPI0013966C3D|nr:sugar dehydrogenase complex small subunit [Roseovarius dicentrarchi]
MNRRRALAALTATSALALVPIASRAASDAGAKDFLDLSRRLTGKSDLGAPFANRMLAAFESVGRGEGISALIDGADDPDLANDVVAAWYSGASPDPDSPTVLGYQEALMWRALDYATPMAMCGGAMGHWADPPAT